MLKGEKLSTPYFNIHSPTSSPSCNDPFASLARLSSSTLTTKDLINSFNSSGTQSSSLSISSSSASSMSTAAAQSATAAAVAANNQQLQQQQKVTRRRIHEICGTIFLLLIIKFVHY